MAWTIAGIMGLRRALARLCGARPFDLSDAETRRPGRFRLTAPPANNRPDNLRRVGFPVARLDALLPHAPACAGKGALLFGASKLPGLGCIILTGSYTKPSLEMIFLEEVP